LARLTNSLSTRLKTYSLMAGNVRAQRSDLGSSGQDVICGHVVAHLDQDRELDTIRKAGELFQGDDVRPPLDLDL
jgi:hypothetical protein